MAVNLKKGFFRLWFVLSILWVAFATFVFGPDILESLNSLPKQKAFEKAYEFEKKKLLRELPDDKEAIYEKELKQEILPKIEFKIKGWKKSAELFLNPTPDIIEQSPVTVTYRKVIKDFPPKTSPQAIWIEFEPQITKIKNEEILKFFSIALVPLVIFLVIELLFIWVIKGFIGGS
jgi:hypothetical protein